jgi:cytochrome c biogenesis protein CcdA
MIDSTELVKFVLTISGTLAALCVPACSVIFFIYANTDDKEDEDRYGTIASLCAVTGVLFVATLLTCLFSLTFEVCHLTYYYVIFEFLVGCGLVILIFFAFTGVTFSIRRRLPKFRKKTSQPPTARGQETATVTTQNT